MDGSKTDKKALILLRRRDDPVPEIVPADQSGDLLCNFVKNDEGSIEFVSFSPGQCKRCFQELIDTADAASLAGQPLETSHVIRLDSCTLNILCFHLLSKLQSYKFKNKIFTNMCFEVHMGASCKIVTLQDAESALVSCLSDLQLKSIERKSKVHENSDNSGGKVRLHYFALEFYDQAASSIKMPPTKKENQPSVTIPVAVYQRTQNKHLVCVESVLLSAAIQVSTCNEVDFDCFVDGESFHPSSPFLVSGAFEALSKRPAKSQPLKLIGFPLQSEFTTKTLPFVNEKRLTNLEIVLDPNIRDGARDMLQQALAVIENSLFLRKIYVPLRYYPEAFSDFMFFVQGLRKITPRLRLPLEFSHCFDKSFDEHDPPTNEYMMELYEGIDAMLKTKHSMSDTDLTTLELLIRAKMFNNVKIPLHLLPMDIFRNLRQYVYMDF